MITNKRIQVPIYNFIIDVTIFDEWKEIVKYYSNGKEDEREGFVLTNELNPTKIKFFINVECPSCIIHEIIHVKNIIFDIIGHNSNRYNDEPEAYLVQYLYKKIIEVYYKHKDNTKK